MARGTKILGIAGLLAVLSACQGPSAALPALSLDAKMTADNFCAQGVSPAIAVSRVPAGAARYRVRFQNVGVLFGAAQDFEIAAAPQGLAEGALERYRGVCPGERQRFEIRIEVLALDAQGRALAYGTTSQSVTSTTSMLRAREAQ